jgi:hypothetical protein
MANTKQYMPGDLLFYTHGENTLADNAIRAWTSSDVVHVAIAESALIKIDAFSHGVIKSPIDYNTVAFSYYLHESANPLVTENIASAMLWVQRQVGQMYGYGDIVNAVLSKLEHGFTIDIGENYDCSGLSAEFLIKCGGTPVSDIANAHNITPVELARVLGVLPV